jgi:chemotaxis-related protein WspD
MTAPQQPDIDDCWNRIGVWSKAIQRCPKLEEVVHCANCVVYSAAAQRLLDREVPSGYLQECADGIVQQKASREDRHTASVVMFRLGDEWFGLPTDLLQEVVEFRSVHRVPHHPSRALRGVVNVRGELQLCVSLGKLMGIAKGEVNSIARGVYERLVVMNKGGKRYVFPVSEIREVHRYHDSELQSAPATVARSGTHYIRGMLHWQEKHVGCLDQDLLFAALQRELP